LLASAISLRLIFSLSFFVILPFFPYSFFLRDIFTSNNQVFKNKKVAAKNKFVSLSHNTKYTYSCMCVVARHSCWENSWKMAGILYNSGGAAVGCLEIY